jgi:hypothetical protein
VKPSIEGLRHLRGQGWTYKRIAEEYGLSEGKVYMMLSGDTEGDPCAPGGSCRCPAGPLDCGRS